MTTIYLLDKAKKRELGIEIIAAMKADAYGVDIEQGRLMALEVCHPIEQQRLDEQADFIAEHTLQALSRIRSEIVDS